MTSYTHDYGDPDLNIFFGFTDLSGDPSSTFNWGDTLNVHFAVTNDGTQDIPSGGGLWFRLYLSTNNIITSLDEELMWQVFGYSLQAGWYINHTHQITLPSEPPSGFPASGQFYIGVVIDPDNLVVETNESDNSNVGETWDYAPVNISP